jgi:hypothetical protein
LRRKTEEPTHTQYLLSHTITTLKKVPCLTQVFLCKRRIISRIDSKKMLMKKSKQRVKGPNPNYQKTLSTITMKPLRTISMKDLAHIMITNGCRMKKKKKL